jgi:uncharacterized protein YpmB
MPPGKVLLIAILCLLTSCIDTTKTQKITKQQPTNKCSTALASSLKESNVKFLSGSTNSQKVNGIASSENPVGFLVPAKAGQLIKYTSSDDVCITLFSPDSKPMTSGEIGADGKYIIQVSVPEGSRTFAGSP